MALAFGDTTAKRAGRLTLNPCATSTRWARCSSRPCCPSPGVGAYGWAKPVPVITGNLRSPRNHTVLVSLVGPLTNFVLAALMGVVLRGRRRPGRASSPRWPSRQPGQFACSSRSFF